MQERPALPARTTWPSISPRDALAGDRFEVARPAATSGCAARASCTIAAQADARSPVRARRPAAGDSLHRGQTPVRAPSLTATIASPTGGPRSACRSCRRPACRRAPALQRLGVANQHAGLGAAAGADHDRHRRREAERARTRDDQHGDGAHQRQREPRLGTPDAPRQQRATPATATTAGTKYAAMRSASR